MIPFYSLLRREIMRFMKVAVQTVVTPLVSSLLYLIVFGVSLGSVMETQNGVDYLAFLIPGLMMMGLMNNAFQNSSSSVVISKYSGELEDFRSTPLTNHQMIWAFALGSVVRGGAVAIVTYLAGAGFYWLQKGAWLGVAHPLEFIFFVLIGGFVFGLLGLGVAIWAKSFDQMSAFSAFLLMPLSYLGGVFISIQSLHPFWQNVSEYNPVLYFINGLRHSILGVSDVGIERSMIVSLVAAVLFYALGLFSLKKGSFHRW